MRLTVFLINLILKSICTEDVNKKTRDNSSYDFEAIFYPLLLCLKEDDDNLSLSSLESHQENEVAVTNDKPIETTEEEVKVMAIPVENSDKIVTEEERITAINLIKEYLKKLWNRPHVTNPFYDEKVQYFFNKLHYILSENGENSQKIIKKYLKFLTFIQSSVLSSENILSILDFIHKISSQSNAIEIINLFYGIFDLLINHSGEIPTNAILNNIKKEIVSVKQSSIKQNPVKQVFYESDFDEYDWF